MDSNNVSSKRKEKRIRQEKNRRRKEAIEKVLNNKDLVELIDSFILRNFIMNLSVTLLGGAFNDGRINGTLYFKNEKEPIDLLKSIEDYISFVEDRPFNDIRYWISDDKIKSLGWTIKKKFNEELDTLIL